MPEQAGGAALLFDPESVEELCDCIRRLWTDDSLCAELSERGRGRAAAWGPSQFAARLAEIIEKVTAQGFASSLPERGESGVDITDL